MTDSVNDHGLETIRKSGLIPDDTKSTQYAIRTKEYSSTVNELSIETLSVTTTPQSLDLPESTNGFTLFHQDVGVKVYFGDSNVSTSGYPFIENNDTLELDVDDETEINFRTDSGTATLFVMTGVKA